MKHFKGSLSFPYLYILFDSIITRRENVYVLAFRRLSIVVYSFLYFFSPKSSYWMANNNGQHLYLIPLLSVNRETIDCFFFFFFFFFVFVFLPPLFPILATRYSLTTASDKRKKSFSSPLGYSRSWRMSPRRRLLTTRYTKKKKMQEEKKEILLWAIWKP